MFNVNIRLEPTTRLLLERLVTLLERQPQQDQETINGIVSVLKSSNDRLQTAIERSQ